MTTIPQVGISFSSFHTEQILPVDSELHRGLFAAIACVEAILKGLCPDNQTPPKARVTVRNRPHSTPAWWLDAPRMAFKFASFNAHMNGFLHHCISLLAYRSFGSERLPCPHRPLGSWAMNGSGITVPYLLADEIASSAPWLPAKPRPIIPWRNDRP